MTTTKSLRGRFSCDVCGTQWTGLGMCHCAACHLQFRSVTGFDMHRSGEPAVRRCLTPMELSVPGEKTGKPRMVAIQTALGPVWVTETRDLSPRSIATGRGRGLSGTSHRFV